MLLAALQSVPRELYESADIDGAGKARQLFQITFRLYTTPEPP
jgi:multiple sugar transport system permease protein